MDDKDLNDLFQLGGVGAIRDHFKSELGELSRERLRFRAERFWWFTLLSLTVVACGVAALCFLWAVGAHKWGEDSQEQVAKAEANAKAYRVMLLENKIDPETGKAWTK